MIKCMMIYSPLDRELAQAASEVLQENVQFKGHRWSLWNYVFLIADRAGNA